MRRFLIVPIMAMLIAGTAPAFAGNLTFSNGRSQWQSTRCTEPVTPPAFASVNSETPAGSMNELSASYNTYATQMQSYMDCISDEAQSDSGMANQVIGQSAQTTIEAAQHKVTMLRGVVEAQR